MMYLHGLSKRHFESYEKSSKQNQMRMVTLFGQQMYSSKDKSYGFGNELMKDTNHESVDCQDTIDLTFPLRINEATGANWFGKRSDKETNSGRSALPDLNKSPANDEPETSSEKSGSNGGFGPICLDDDVRAATSSPASCCTAEKNSMNKDEDTCEVIQMAAKCLVHISSSVSLNQSRDFLNITEKGNEEHSRSCDSFELNTLGITETIAEELCCVTSSSKVNNKKEFGVKLRRGRRMKNFQKEILPELVSLSRHEIREDINILEAVLRSRDYKKKQGKTRDGQSRPKQRNSKGLNQIGRRSRRTKS